MKIDYDNSRTRLVNIIETDTDGDKKTPEQLFSDLYELQNNSELNDNQLDYIKNLVNEIWCD